MYILEVERAGNMSDCGYNNKTHTRAGSTYSLKVEMEGNVSDCSDYKTWARTTYLLEVEREGNASDCGCSYKIEPR
jgi:hypothetical protein